MSFNVLHISDLHYGTDHAFEYTGNDPNRRSLADAIERALDNHHVEKIDCAVLTGDLFCSDQPTEASLATECLKSLIEKLDLKPNKVMIVPGNHDLTWKEEFKNNRFKFFENVLKDAKLFPKSFSYPEIIVYKTGMTKDLAFVLLDSCNLEGINTAGYGLVGEPQIDNIDKKLKQNGITAESHYILAVMHHHLLPLWPVYPIWNRFNPNALPERFSYSTTLDARSVMNILTKIGAIALLHGHQHRPAISEHIDRLDSEKRLHILSAGSAGVIEEGVRRHFFIHEILEDEIKVWSYWEDRNDSHGFKRIDTPARIPLVSTPFSVVSPSKDQKRGQSLWQLGDPKNLVIVVSNSAQTRTGGYLRSATGIGQVRALTYCIESLACSYTGLGPHNVLLSDDSLLNQFDNDFIILGGPKTNKLACELLKKMAKIQPGTQNGSKIIWQKRDANESWSVVNSDVYNGKVIRGEVVSDYGLIIRTYNPFSSRNRRMILFTGSHTFGTIAAAKYFVESILDYKPKKVMKDGMNFTILIKCDVIDQHPTNIAVEKEFFWRNPLRRKNEN